MCFCISMAIFYVYVRMMNDRFWNSFALNVLRRLLSLLLFKIGCFGSIIVLAQDPVAIRYTVEDGLPSNEVYDAYEDKIGNIWFATDHGVSRYDGYSFKNYTKQDGLSDNTVFEFKEDAAGIVWMRCFNGTLSYMVDGKIRPYPFNDRLLKRLKGGFFANFDIDGQHRMYFTVYRRGETTVVLDLLTGEVDSLQLGPGMQAALIATDDPLHRVCAVAVPESPLSGFDGDHITCKAGAKKWALDLRKFPGWRNGRNISFSIGPDVDIGIFGPHIQRIEGCAVTHSELLAYGSIGIIKDRGDQIWVMTRQGVIRLNAQLQPDERFFQQDFCMGMLQDRHGSYWICTTNGVLAVRDFDSRVYQIAGGNPLANARRLCIVGERLYLLHGNDAVSTALIGPSQLHWGEPVRKGNDHTFLHELIPAMPDSLGMEMGTYTELVERLMYFPHKDVIASAAWQLRWQGGRILGTTSRGFHILSLRNGALHWDKRFEQLGLSCTAILDNGRGKVWVGTARGLYVFEGDRFFPYDSTHHLLRERVTDLALLPDDVLVVSTRGNGLLFLRRGQVISVGEAQGLSSNLCNRLYVGPSGLWVCSNMGLSLLRGKSGPSGFSLSGSILNYTILDGLPSNKVNDVLEYKGKIFVATENGLAAFDGPRAGNVLPLTKIEQVKVDDRVVSRGEALTAEDAHVQVRFRGEKLSALGNIRYRYKLEGFDQKWRSTTENIADYYNLPPGAYTFRVSAGYPSTQENPHEDRFSFFLPYHFYERLWVRVLAGLLLFFVGLLGVWRYNLGRQRRLHANNNRLQAEVKALRSQMRPHFIFNTLNSIQQFILNQDPVAAQMHLSRFAKLMRGVLEASNQEAIPISQEIELLQRYLELEKLRFGDDFVYVIDLQQGVDWEAAKIPPMLLQPLVENAVWHGLRLQKVDPKVSLRFSLTPGGSICCEVEDNGIGRKAAALRASAHRGASFGLSNIEDRIRLLNTLQPGSLHLQLIDLVADGEARGTLARLTLQHLPHEPQKT